MIQGLSSEAVDRAKAEFWNRYDQYMELVRKARGIEILIRIVAELTTTYDYFYDKNFEQFRDSSYAHQTKKYQKLIKEFLPAHEDKLQKVRLIADAVAHLDLVKARAKLIEYGKKYELACVIDEKPVGIVRLNNVLCEDGETRDLGYSIKSGEENLLTEEMDVFQRQGGYQAADVLFDEIRALLETEAEDIEVIELSVRTHRGLKHGKPL